MKKFTKLFLACAAVTAVTAAMAATAMAATPITGDVTGSYESGEVKLDKVPEGATTILVLEAGTTITSITDENILYINQGDFTSIKLLGAPSDEEATDAIIMIGCNEGTDNFSIKTAKIGASEGEEIIIGDTDLMGTVTADDAGFILRALAKKDTVTGKVYDEYVAVDDGTKVIIGDTDLMGSVTADDAGFILRALAKKDTVTGRVYETLEVVPVSE